MDGEEIGQIVKRYRLHLAVLLVLMIFFLSWILLDYVQGNTEPNTKEKIFAYISVLFNLVSSVIAFTVVTLLYSKEDRKIQDDSIKELISGQLKAGAERQETVLRRIVTEVVGKSSTLEQVKWQSLIDGANQIDFIVQGWDRWFTQIEMDQSLKRFFERGGHFRLYTYSPRNEDNSKNLETMGARTGKAPEQVVQEIKGTQKALSEILTEAGQSKENIQIFETSEIIWYFAARFKTSSEDDQIAPREVIVFSIYSHTSGQRPWRLPAITVYPDAEQGSLSQWFEKEVQFLSKDEENSSETQNVEFVSVSGRK